MKTIIAGSRSITRHGLVRAAIVASTWADAITEVVSGCARGVDQVGEMWAREKGVLVREFPADWDTHGKAAGPIRNEQMAAYADALIAVWDGSSSGTADMIRRARQLGLKVYVHKEVRQMQIAPTTTTLRNPIWISLICRECGELFGSIDPDRKWCDAHLVKRVNGAGILEDDDDQDDLFTERTLECQGCGATFTTTNPRSGDRCVECNAGLKVKVVCPVCDIPHVVALLAPHKLCLSCTADLEMTRAMTAARVEQALLDANVASSTLIDDCNATDAETRRRYEVSVELRQTGQMNGATYTQAQRTAAWQKALARGDSLSPLLAGYDVWEAARQTLERAQAALAAIEEVL